MSDVSEILTGRVNLKRLSAMLLDGITPSFAVSFDRQPVRASRMEVEISGASILVGATVLIEGNGSASIDQYVIADRSLGVNWSIQINNSTVSLTETLLAASAEPIVQDGLNSSDYWKIYVNYGVISIEGTATVQNDILNLKDQIDLINYILGVSNGSLGISTQQSNSELFIFSSDGIKSGIVDFTSLARITSYGIVGGSIFVRAINGMGQPINQRIDVVNDLPVRFYAQNGRIRMLKQGQDKIAKYKIMAEPDADVRDNDVIFAVSGCFGLTYGQIDFVEKFYDFDGVTHHTEAEIIDL